MDEKPPQITWTTRTYDSFMAQTLPVRTNLWNITSIWILQFEGSELSIPFWSVHFIGLFSISQSVCFGCGQVVSWVQQGYRKVNASLGISADEKTANHLKRKVKCEIKMELKPIKMRLITYELEVFIKISKIHKDIDALCDCFVWTELYAFTIGNVSESKQ